MRLARGTKRRKKNRNPNWEWQPRGERDGPVENGAQADAGQSGEVEVGKDGAGTDVVDPRRHALDHVERVGHLLGKHVAHPGRIGR